jgi:hypothetical protein
VARSSKRGRVALDTQASKPKTIKAMPTLNNK